MLALTFKNSVEILIVFDKIKDVQQSLGCVDSALVTQLEALLRKPGFDYNCVAYRKNGDWCCTTSNKLHLWMGTSTLVYCKVSFTSRIWQPNRCLDKLCFSYVNLVDAEFLSARDDIMLCRYNIFLSAKFRHENPSADMLRLGTSYVKTFLVSVQRAVSPDSSFQHLWQYKVLEVTGASRLAAPTHAMKKNLLKKEKVLRWFIQKSRHTSRFHYLGLINLDDKTLFAYNEKAEKMLVVMIDSNFNRTEPLSASLHVQSFHLLE